MVVDESKSRGRPREFDEEQALTQAMRVFWRKGFDGASMGELTQAMGINAPSLYAAFGNKEQLFRRVLEQYGAGPARYVNDALEEPTARGVAERRLYGAADAMTAPQHPWGCMVVQAATACSEAAAPIREELIAARCGTEDALRIRFERALVEGDLPADTDAAALATFISTVINGMSVKAASGASREELHAVAKVAMRAWPE
jgi:AcrR family transcriptional regulator